MLRRKRFDILRKRPIRFTQKAINHSSVQRRQQVWDDIRLTERLSMALSASFADSLTLQDFVVAISSYLALDDINLEEVLVELLEETGIYHAVILEHLTLSDHAAHTSGESVTDTITLSDTVLYDYEVIQSTERTETVSDSVDLFDTVTYVLETLQTVTDSISVSDTVSYEVQTAGEPMIIPDGYVVYNHNFVQVPSNLTVWWDNNTSTSFIIYYTPPAPNNPRYAYLFFADYPTVTKFKIFVPSFTPGKSLIIEVSDFSNNTIYTATVPLTAGQLITVEPNTPLMSVAQVAVYTDSTIEGFVEIAEFQAYISGGGN